MARRGEVGDGSKLSDLGLPLCEYILSVLSDIAGVSEKVRYLSVGPDVLARYPA